MQLPQWRGGSRNRTILPVQGGFDMMKRIYAVVCTLLFLSYGMAGVDQAFAKGSGDAVRKKFPENRFIIRSGTGESPEKAAEAARFEIAKFFESKISGETLVKEWAQSATARGKRVDSRMTEITNTVAIAASRDIPGIEIAATDEDKSAGLYEAWAVVDREKLLKVLQERIAGIDRDVDSRLAAQGATDMAKVAAFSRSMRDLVSREQTRQDILLLGGNVESRSGVLHAVLTGLDSLIADAFDVGIVFEGGVDVKVKSLTLKGVADAGIRIKEYADQAAAGAGGADLVMVVAHEVTKRKTSNTAGGREFVFFWVDWVLSVKAVDPAGGEIIGTTVLTDKISGGTDEQAAERMVGKMLQTQIPKVTSWIAAMVFDPEKK